MKIFLLTLISFVALIIFASCGLIYTTEGAPTKEQKELVEKYAGLYVFDKKLRDEIIQREKEREEYREKYLGEYIQVGNETHFVDFAYLNNKFPQTLSNGCKYYTGLFTAYDYKKIEPYIQKIKDYMGEEAFNKLQPNILLISFYTINENGVEKDIPIEISVSISWYKTTYGIYGDEGAGIRFTETRRVGLGNFFNTFYLIDDKFIRYKEDRTKQNYKSSTKDKQ